MSKEYIAKSPAGYKIHKFIMDYGDRHVFRVSSENHHIEIDVSRSPIVEYRYYVNKLTGEIKDFNSLEKAIAYCDKRLSKLESIREKRDEKSAEIKIREDEYIYALNAGLIPKKNMSKCNIFKKKFDAMCDRILRVL